MYQVLLCQFLQLLALLRQSLLLSFRMISELPDSLLISAISVEPFEGPSLRTTVVPDVPSTSAVIVSAVASDEKALHDSHQGESGTLLEVVSNALSSGVVVETHGGEDPPPFWRQ